MIEAAVVKSIAVELGFAACGIAKAERLPESEYPLEEWLARGYNADMQYMERNIEMRRDPRLLVEGARSVISLLVLYKSDRVMEGRGKIAQYAYGEDYHERLKRMMYSLMALIKERYPDFEGRPFVDTAPISDRHWAVRAGLGWIGRNTLFVHPRYGSYCFLGEIVTTSTVDCYDTPMELSVEDETHSGLIADPQPTTCISPKQDSSMNCGCGSCRLCLDACPNKAITIMESGAPMLDARRCTSYNTIENRADRLPDELDTRGYAYGCDICQMVCPYNRHAPASFHLDDQRKAELESLTNSDDIVFSGFTKHSAMSRIKYLQWRRNVDICK